MAEEVMLCAPTTCAMHSAHARAIKVHDDRLNSHSTDIDNINDCITRLTLLQEQTIEWQKKADNRISSLEAVPAKRWNDSVTTFITAIVSALAGACIVMATNGVIGG